MDRIDGIPDLNNDDKAKFKKEKPMRKEEHVPQRFEEIDDLKLDDKIDKISFEFA